MIRTAIRVAIGSALIGVGWAAGHAQSSQPDFELIVNAPAGQTTVECVRGCELVWVERGINPEAKRMPTFKYGCSGPGQERCSSARIGGWIKKEQ